MPAMGNVVRSSKGNSPRVLCIGRDPASLHLRQLILRSRGYTVTTATTGLQALRLLESTDLDLIIIEAPESPGLVADIKRRRPGTAVIAITRTERIPAEAEAHVPKSDGPYQLLAKAEELLHWGLTPHPSFHVPDDERARERQLDSALRKALGTASLSQFSAPAQNEFTGSKQDRVPQHVGRAWHGMTSWAHDARFWLIPVTVAACLLLSFFLWREREKMLRGASHSAAEVRIPAEQTTRSAPATSPTRPQSEVAKRARPYKDTRPSEAQPQRIPARSQSSVLAQRTLPPTGPPDLQVNPSEPQPIPPLGPESAEGQQPALPAVPQPIPKLDSNEEVPATATAPDNQAPLFVSDRSFRAHSGWVTGVAFSVDGQMLASGGWDHTVKLWDTATGQRLRTLSEKVNGVQTVAFSRDGKWLAAEGSDNTVTLWDAASGHKVRALPGDKPWGLFGGANWAYSISFSPDGRWLASGVDDRTVRLWDVKTGHVVRDLAARRRKIIYVAFSPNGHYLASGGDDKTIRIWDASTGKVIRTLPGHKKDIYAVAFSPDGRLLASASGDRSIGLWDLANGQEVRTLSGHHGLVTSVVFSANGRLLASGSWDNSVKIWDTSTGRELQTLESLHHVYTVAFSPNSSLLASGTEDGTIEVWRFSQPTGQQSPQ